MLTFLEVFRHVTTLKKQKPHLGMNPTNLEELVEMPYRRRSLGFSFHLYFQGTRGTVRTNRQHTLVYVNSHLRLKSKRACSDVACDLSHVLSAMRWVFSRR